MPLLSFLRVIAFLLFSFPILRVSTYLLHLIPPTYLFRSPGACWCCTWDLVSWPGIGPICSLGVRSLGHWATREVPNPFYFLPFSFLLFSQVLLALVGEEWRVAKIQQGYWYNWKSSARVLIQLEKLCCLRDNYGALCDCLFSLLIPGLRFLF